MRARDDIHGPSETDRELELLCAIVRNLIDLGVKLGDLMTCIAGWSKGCLTNTILAKKTSRSRHRPNRFSISTPTEREIEHE
jgi:hypothetical protein